MAKSLPSMPLTHSPIIARSMASEWLVRTKRGLQASVVSLSALLMVPMKAASQRARFWLMASEMEEGMGPIRACFLGRAPAGIGGALVVAFGQDDPAAIDPALGVGFIDGKPDAPGHVRAHGGK